MQLARLLCLAAGLGLLVAIVGAKAAEGDTPSAQAAPSRSAADLERDTREHPQAVLDLAGFKRGMVIADIFGGGGYYSEILARVVGSTGRVRLVNNVPYHEYAKEDSSVRLANDRLPNVSYEVVPAEAMNLGVASLDGAIMVMAYHDLYVADPENGWPAIEPGQFIDQIVTALKPGAALVIVDHQAREGTGMSDAQTLHRIEEAFARADFQAHGLGFAGSIEDLRNPADPHTQGVMNPAVRGKTDRFVHLYRKPE